MTVGLTDMATGRAQQALANNELDQLRQIADRLPAPGSPNPDDPDALRQQSAQFESLILNMMLATMRKTVETSDLFGGSDSPGRQIYTAMLDNEYARIMAETGQFGLGSMLMEQFGGEGEGLKPAPASRDILPGSLAGLGGGLSSVGKTVGGFLSPLRGEISSHFGMRVHPVSNQLQMHEGVDLVVPVGTPVQATAAGRVLFAGERGGYGNLVVIEHENGIQSLYGHLDSMDVAVGDRVERGQIVARSGNTGLSTGPHLHFEIRLGGRPVNPVEFLRRN